MELMLALIPPRNARVMFPTSQSADPVQLAAQSFSNLHQNEDEGDGENCIESYW